jgi:hypothetical protein
MAQRGVNTEKFLFRGPEMQAVNLAMEIHDKQLESSMISELENMTAYVAEQIRLKKARAIA